MSYKSKVYFCLLHKVTEEYVGQSHGSAAVSLNKDAGYRSSLSTKPLFSVRGDGLASGWNAALMSSPWSESAA